MLPWSIPAKKALASLPFYLLVPVCLWFFYALLFDPAWLDRTAQYVGLLKIMAFIWIMRTMLRFLVFVFVRKRTRRISALSER